VKDLGFVVDTADALGYPLVMGSAAHQLYKMAAAQGLNNLDDSIMIVLAEQLAGMNPDGSSQ
jgi:3-hydroxyisobutyrate dehydrogenase-like beta-hydroxyacid dehydrogenase